MDRRKPLVVAGAMLLGVATALVATGTALGLVSLAPPETRIGRVQPIHTQQPAAPVVDLTPPAPAVQSPPAVQGPAAGQGTRPGQAASPEEAQEREQESHETETIPDLDDD